jgi:hypothetical protein
MNPQSRALISWRGLGASTALALLMASGCTTQQQKDKTTIERFRQSCAGQWQSDSGAILNIAPVRARMVTDEAVYVERTDAGGVVGRLLNVEIGPNGKLMQRALTFTQEGQWRNLREQPELFTALLPKDVRPAGTCDIQVATDANSLSYSCGGSKPETFLRRQ